MDCLELPFFRYGYPVHAPEEHVQVVVGPRRISEVVPWDPRLEAEKLAIRAMGKMDPGRLDRVGQAHSVDRE